MWLVNVLNSGVSLQSSIRGRGRSILMISAIVPGRGVMTTTRSDRNTAAIAALAAGTAAAQDRPVDRVSVRADVFFYGAHVPIMLGIVDGIYKKHGIDATFAAGRGSATTIQTVANMSDQFGFADGATLVRLTAQGLRAKQIVGILQIGSNSIMTLPDSGITKPQDLNGKTTGFAPGSATDQIFPAFAKKAGARLRQHQGDCRSIRRRGTACSCSRRSISTWRWRWRSFPSCRSAAAASSTSCASRITA